MGANETFYARECTKGQLAMDVSSRRTRQAIKSVWMMRLNDTEEGWAGKGFLRGTGGSSPLCRRANQPGLGYTTFTAFVDQGELSSIVSIM